jgi:hypothetical protein
MLILYLTDFIFPTSLLPVRTQCKTKDKYWRRGCITLRRTKPHDTKLIQFNEQKEDGTKTWQVENCLTLELRS